MRRLISLTTIGALVLALLGALFPLSAKAANNSLIVANLEGFTRVDASGNPIANPGQMYVGDYIAMSVSFDASEADPVPGDSFTIELPAQFTNIEFGRPGREIIKPLMFGDLQAGDCVIEERKFTCTFNNAIVGQNNVKGAIAARLVASAEANTNQVPLNLNGTTVNATIPGSSNIAVKQTSFTVNNNINKGATGLGVNAKAVNWVIYVGGGWLTKNRAGENTFTVIDTLPNKLLTGPATNRQVSLMRATPASNGKFERVADANSAPVVPGYELKYVANDDGLTFRLEVTTPQEFTNQENYQINFTTPTADGGSIDTGWVYENYMQIEGNDQVVRAEKFYVESFEATVSYHEGFGTFQITKKATGAGELTDDQEFEVEVNYQLPNTAWIAPSGWTLPDNPFRVKVKPGANTLVNPQLPDGTIITVVEDLSVANANQAGVKWATPVFAPANPADAGKFTITEGGAKASFKIERSNTLKLQLTNTSVIESTFQVAKTVAGDDAAAYQGQTFEFNYVCSDSQTGTISAPGDGTPVEVPKKFATGTTCTVSEVDPPARPGYTLTKASDASVTVMSAVQRANMVNTYRRDSGDFSITKTLNANGSRGFETFQVAYECSAPGYGPEADGTTVEAKGTATIVAGETTRVGRFPIGTTCRVTSEEPQLREGYEFTHDLGAAVTIDADGEAVTVTNTYEPHKGTFSVKKSVAGNGSVGPADEKFTLAYTCTPLKRTGLDPISGTVEVTEGVSVQVGEFLAGTKCVVTGETAADRDGYTLTQDFGSEVTIANQENSEIEVTNTYTRDMGTFAITKAVEANGSSGSASFTLDYVCDAEGSTADGSAVPAAGKVQISDGETVAVGNFPAGTSCKVTGEPVADAREGYSLATDFGSEVKIAKDATATVKVTNTYSRDYAPFTVDKVIVANGSTGSDTVTVSYECSAEGKDGVPAAADVELSAGIAKLIGQFPTGTTCKVIAEPAADVREGYSLTTDLGSEVTIAKQSGGSITVTNTYARDFAQLRITKAVVANGSTGPGTFTLDYSCDAPGRTATGDPVDQQGKVEVTDGNTTVVGEFPTGTKCSVTDEADAPREGYTLTKELGEEITLAKNQAPDAGITVTNTYTRDFGNFLITKGLVDGGSTGANTFLVDYVCSAAGNGVEAEGSVEVKAGETTLVGSFPTGTSCRVSDEDRALAKREGYTLGVEFGEPVTIVKNGATATVTNTYVRQLGGFVINKTVAGDGVALAPSTVQFTYDCADLDPVTVEVTPGVPFQVSDVPTGACTITEGDASVAFTDLESSITIDGQASAEGAFTVSEQSTVEVGFTNTYTLHRGTFEVIKTISAADQITAGPFKFNYTCGDLQGTLEVPGDGVAVAGPQIPLNTECTISEDAAAGQVEDYALSVPEPQTVTIASRTEPAKATFVNQYRRHSAGFSISKQVDGADFAADEFTFGYACADVTGTVKVKGNGAAVSAGVDLPTGTKCRVWEETESAQRAGYRLTAPAEQTIVLTGDGSNEVLSFVNQYTADEPAPSPTPTATPDPEPPAKPKRPGLPKTGD